MAHRREAFVKDLESRLANRVQLTSDGLKLYFNAIRASFGSNVDYAMLRKIFGGSTGSGPETRYSPTACVGAESQIMIGSPDPAHINTSFVERRI